MSNEAPTDALRLVPVEPTEEMVADGVKAAQRAEQTCVSWPEMVSFTYRAMLSAAPASPLPGGGWQDISTAPKDGTLVLTWGYLHDDGGPYDADGRSFTGETPSVQISGMTEFGWSCPLLGGHHPTHWMPLPTVPAEIAK